MNINKQQKEILRHTLGIREKFAKPYRNHFADYPGNENYKICEQLVEMGLMYKSPKQNIDYSCEFFHVTEKGRQLSMNKKEQEYHKRIRVGDTVKIINPIIFEQVGYPLTKQRVMKEYMKKDDVAKIDSFIKDFGIVSSGLDYNLTTSNIYNKVFERIADALAYGILYKNDFGGNRRMLHVYDEPELKEWIAKVVHRKVVKTGVRESGGYDPEGDYTAPILRNKKTHVIFKLQLIKPSTVNKPFDFNDVQKTLDIIAETEFVQIENIHLEKLSME